MGYPFGLAGLHFATAATARQCQLCPCHKSGGHKSLVPYAAAPQTCHHLHTQSCIKPSVSFSPHIDERHGHVCSPLCCGKLHLASKLVLMNKSIDKDVHSSKVRVSKSKMKGASSVQDITWQQVIHWCRLTAGRASLCWNQALISVQ